MSDYKPIWIKAVPKEGELKPAPPVEGEFKFGRLTHLQFDYRRNPSNWFIVAFDPYSRDVTPYMLNNFIGRVDNEVIDYSPYATTQEALGAAKAFLDKKGFKSASFALEDVIDAVKIE